MYKAIAEIRSPEDEKRVRESVGEIYGRIPQQVDNLILISTLKRMARKMEVIKLTVSNKDAKMVVKDINSFKDGRLTRTLNKFKNDAVLSFDVNPVITVTTGDGALSNALTLKSFLEFAISLPTEDEK